MKVEDIQIGDWVQTPKGTCRVISIQDNDVIFTDIADGIDGSFYINEVKPIPLMPEILKKNEFVKIGKTGVPGTVYSWVEDMCAFPQTLIEFTVYDRRISDIKSLLRCSSPYKPGSGRNEIHICGIESVHELQHALRLCGIEKTIELQ